MPAFWLVCLFVALGSDRRLLDAALTASATTGLAAWIVPQLLSTVDALTPDNTKFAWLALTAFVLIPLWQRVRRGGPALVGQVRGVLACPVVITADGSEPSPAHVRRTRAAEGVWRLTVAFFLGATFVAAVLYPPTVWDSLSHHLPRVAQFIQNQTVAPFPTYYAAMDSTYPFSAYVLTQLRLLAGGDILLNLAQWSAYAMVVALVYRTTRLLGAPVYAARFSALVALSAPALALQATTTQYDLVAALWAVGAVYVSLRLVVDAYGDGPTAGTHRRLDGWLVVLYGVLFGLAAVTKVTALIVVAPFALWTAVAIFGTSTSTGATRRDRLRSVLRAYGLALLAAALAVGIALPLALSNVRDGGNVLGTADPGNAQVLVSERSAGALWMNAVRNLSITLATPSDAANGVVRSAAAFVGGALGVSVDSPANMDDPDATYELPTSVLNPDLTSAPLAVLLIGVGAIGMVASRKVRREVFPVAYGAIGLLALLATASLITWQPFVVRALVPSLAALTPLAGVGVWAVAEGSRSRRLAHVGRALLYGVLSLAVAYGAATVTFSSTSPLAPRPSLSTDTATDVGWWNTPYAERGWRGAAGFLAPVYDESQRVGDRVASTHRALFTPLATEANRDIEWPPVALLGGGSGTAVPVNPLVDALTSRGFAILYEGRYGPENVPGLYAAFDGAPSLVVSMDQPGALGSAQVNGSPVSLDERYQLESSVPVPEIGIVVSFYTLVGE